MSRRMNMSNSCIDTEGLAKSVNYLADSLESFLKYVYEAVPKNIRLKDRWQEFYHKVIHSLILTDSLKKLIEEIKKGNTEKDEIEFPLLLAEKLGNSLLLVCEIYKRMYTEWLKYLIEPSIMHKGAYTGIAEIEELEEMEIFVNPAKINSDTHEIARRVERYRTLFDAYNSYMLFRILADAKTVTYISYNRDKLVTVDRDKVDPNKELDFLRIGEALERLLIWRNQFAHSGDYLLACDEIFKSLSIKKGSQLEFEELKVKVLSEFTSLCSEKINKYLDRLFWHIGEALIILKESCEKIEKVFNYHLQK